MAEKKKAEMSFLEHLEELRWHLIRMSLVIVVAAVVAFVNKHFIFDIVLMGPSSADFVTNRFLCSFGKILFSFLSEHGVVLGRSDALCINSEPIMLQSINMAGQFMSHIKISLVAGVIIAFPYVVYELWRFISPALYLKERKYARSAVLIVSLLFLVGVLFGYYLIAPLSVSFLYTYQASEQIINNIQLSSYVSIITSVSFAAGIIFELPVIIFVLSKIGLVTPEFLKKYRRHAIVIILILAAIITPPDVFSQFLVTLPMIVLYELSIKISKRIYKQKQIV